MKLNHLFEMPVLLKGKMKAFKEYEALKSRCEFLFSIDNQFSLYEMSYGLWVIVDEKESSNENFKVIGELLYDINNTTFRFASGKSFLSNLNRLYYDDIIQIETIEISKNYQKRGIAVNIYLELAKTYIIASDYMQFESGKALWKKIAGVKPANIVCLLYSTNDKGNLLYDGINYNGSNVKESDIWNQRHVKMILMAKQKMESIMKNNQ